MFPCQDTASEMTRCCSLSSTAVLKTCYIDAARLVLSFKCCHQTVIDEKKFSIHFPWLSIFYYFATFFFYSQEKEQQSTLHSNLSNCVSVLFSGNGLQSALQCYNKICPFPCTVLHYILSFTSACNFHHPIPTILLAHLKREATMSSFSYAALSTSNTSANKIFSDLGKRIINHIFPRLSSCPKLLCICNPGTLCPE